MAILGSEPLLEGRYLGIIEKIMSSYGSEWSTAD